MRGCASGYETRLAAWRAGSRPRLLASRLTTWPYRRPAAGRCAAASRATESSRPFAAFEHALAVSIAYSGTLPGRVVTLCAYSKTRRYQAKTTFISSLAIGHLLLHNRTAVGPRIGLIVCPPGGPPQP
jgi:hypothetical protein